MADYEYPKLPELSELFTPDPHHLSPQNNSSSFNGGDRDSKSDLLDQLFSKMKIHDQDFIDEIRLRFSKLENHQILPVRPSSGGDNGYGFNNSFHESAHSVNFSKISSRFADIGEDEDECRRLMKMIESGNVEENRRVVAEIWDHLHELMIGRYGNGVVESLFKCCQEIYVNDLLLCVIGKEDLFIDACTHSLGYRPVVSLLERVRCPQTQALFASAISRHVLLLTSNFNAHYVLIQCFKTFSPALNEVINRRIADNSVPIALEKAGCCIIQNCINSANEKSREWLVAPLIREALTISQDCYGNYVIQYLVGMGVPQITARVIQRLKGHYAKLSMDKFGSNVVEKCLCYGENAAIGDIIYELIGCPKFPKLVTSSFGNYVVQAAIRKAQGGTFISLMHTILMYESILQFHPKGKWVIQALKSKRELFPVSY